MVQFKLFAIDKIELANEKLMLENVPGAGVCLKTDAGTGRCSGTMSNILLNTRNSMYTAINAV